VTDAECHVACFRGVTCIRQVVSSFLATSFVTKVYFARKAHGVIRTNNASGSSGTIAQLAVNLEIMAYLMDAVFLVSWGPCMTIALVVAVGLKVTSAWFAAAVLLSQTQPLLCCVVIWTSPMYTKHAYHQSLGTRYASPAVVAPEGQAKDGKQALQTVSGEAKTKAKTGASLVDSTAQDLLRSDLIVPLACRAGVPATSQGRG
jgi:hypothetical protein